MKTNNNNQNANFKEKEQFSDELLFFLKDKRAIYVDNSWRIKFDVTKNFFQLRKRLYFIFYSKNTPLNISNLKGTYFSSLCHS